MKGVDIFCASHAATAICLSMEPSSSSSPASATLLLGSGGGKAIDRHSPIINSKRTPKATSSNPHSKKKKNPRNIPSDENENQPSKTAVSEDGKTHAAANEARKSWSCTKPGDFLSPPGSTRYLLREKVYNPLQDSEENSDKDVKTEEQAPSSHPPPQQVVVLRVSLHCRGCERKLRKHLSRMEGLTSFEIDFAAKKVTVVGSVTPLDVVSSISKVKNAQLWPSTISPSSEMAVV